MIYKTLKKVSEYCQLLDKSKLPNTQTVNGITYTVDKVNGTITANGTATEDSNYKTDIALNNAESYTNGGGTKIPSRILFLGCPIGGSQTTYGLYNNWVSSNVVDKGNGGITDTTSNKYNEYYRFALRIIIKQGYTANNLVFKPQVFDLTEMYGAGNEPTTVEEFRTKFPNELYDYKPYCFVKSYKNCLKISDVCQLMVYPYFETTHTRYGITFTDNGDGTITANGTSVGFATFVFSENFNFIAGNKYYVSTPYSVIAYKENGTMKYAQGNILFTWKSNWEIVQVYMQINKGITVSNLTFKPQIFDLTEMYGSGNEPTTVEQFRSDFPNELYDYKPYSIITSYKKSLVCKTKNLFDINQSINDTSAENAFDTFSINDNVITATSDNSTTKIVVMRLFYGELPAGDYILSLNAVIENTPKHNRPNEIFIFKNGSFLTLNNSMPADGSYSLKIKFTLSEKAEIKILFYKSVLSSQETVSNTVYKVTLSNIQLELGDTATEYHPYGYL